MTSASSDQSCRAPDSSRTTLSKKTRPEFAPLPARAIGDARFTATHFRVLGAIAVHDRMSAKRKTGQGCWASHKTLAALCGVNYNNLSTAISELGQWGYLTRQSHPLNKRQHVYRVVYDISPAGEPSEMGDAPDSSPTDEPKAVNSSSVRELPHTRPSDSIESTSTLRPEKPETQQDQGAGGVEYIPWKREEILQKQKRNSLERVSLKRGDDDAPITPVHRREGSPNYRRKKKTCQPNDFPGETELLYAVETWSESRRADLATRDCAAYEAEKFRDYHLKEGKLSADWPASWRTWVRKAAEFNRPRRVADERDQPRKILKLSEATTRR